MDFKKILEDWNEMQFGDKNFSQKKSSKEKTGEKKIVKNPMEFWLSRYGVIDKDFQIENEIEKKKIRSATFVKKMKIDAKIDLHGKTATEAESALSIFVDRCIRDGAKKILIVHGKGNHTKGDAVLAPLVRAFIEQHPNLGASGHPENSKGGTGATWVLIKGD